MLLVRPLCTLLPKMIGYVKSFDSAKKVSDKKLSKKYTKIWRKFSILIIISKKFDSEPVYGDNDKYIKTKLKICEGNINANFRKKEVPKK